jgi:peptidyl-prolyl cis-trans isomerase B (cyclophilin B)
MRRRTAVSGAALAAAALTACGQSAASSNTTSSGTTAAPPNPSGTRLATAKSVTIELENGKSFTFQLFPELAPKTVDNFVTKVTAGFYNGLSFHRVEDWVVQGGDPSGNGTGGNQMASEYNDRPFNTGSVGIARRNDPRLNNDAQFFIVKLPPPNPPGKWQQLDGQYTNFGQVTDGMDVVRAIKIGDKMKRLTAKS